MGVLKGIHFNKLDEQKITSEKTENPIGKKPTTEETGMLKRFFSPRDPYLYITTALFLALLAGFGDTFGLFGGKNEPDLTRQKTTKNEKTVTSNPEQKQQQTQEIKPKTGTNVKYEEAQSNYKNITQTYSGRYTLYSNLQLTGEGGGKTSVKLFALTYKEIGNQNIASLVQDAGKIGTIPITDTLLNIKYQYAYLSKPIFCPPELIDSLSQWIAKTSYIMLVKQDEDGNLLALSLMDREGNPILDKNGKPFINSIPEIGKLLGKYGGVFLELTNSLKLGDLHERKKIFFDLQKKFSLADGRRINPGYASGKQYNRKLLQPRRLS